MYDLIVLGGGPAGYNAAERAAHSGMKTLVLEGRALGGVCLNEGCVPTKTLLYSAKIFDYAKHGADYGVKTENASIDHSFVVARKDKVVKTLVSGIQMKLKKAGVEVVSEYGKIAGKIDGGFAVEAAGKRYEGAKLLICTGSYAFVPPIPGLREAVASGFAMTNREILDMKEAPASLAVIGGGVIGLEMASYFNSIGTKVTVIEMLDHIAGPTDSEISKILLRNYKAKGVEFLLGAKVTGVSAGKVAYELDGKQCEVSADKVLVSIGRRANTADIGLETVGVQTERGAVVTDEYCKTNIPGIWAAGDVNGKSMLAHTDGTTTLTPTTASAATCSMPWQCATPRLQTPRRATVLRATTAPTVLPLPVRSPPAPSATSPLWVPRQMPRSSTMPLTSPAVPIIPTTARSLASSKVPCRFAAARA